ncbi:MAG: hypothetical protein FJ265_22000, partial [Planctomycetes bacterium]|nr:hypothetical protein [Planctomycetota bacterium]
MNTTSPAVILPVVLAAALAGARAQIVPVAPVLDDEPKRWALIANTANDFYPFEGSSEYYEMLYALNLGQTPFPLQDRDGFPAQALQAYYVLRDTLGYPDDRITLMLYHDDAVGNSFCEIPVTLGPDNDVLGDQFVDPRGVPRGAGVNWLWGPDGLPLTPDDPAIDFDTAAVTKANLRSAVLALGAKATVEDEVVIYLIDHGSDAAGGGSGRLWFENGPDSVTGDEFDQWLDQAFCGHYPRRLVVLADFCFASSFLWPLQVDEGCGEKNRIVVSAADAQ